MILRGEHTELQLLYYAPINVNPVGEGGGVRARGGSWMPETIPPVGLLIVRSDPRVGTLILTLTDKSLVPIQNWLPSLSLEAF